MNTPTKLKRLAESLGVYPRDLLELALFEHNKPRLKKLKLKVEEVTNGECHAAGVLCTEEMNLIRNDMLANQGRMFIYIVVSDRLLDPSMNPDHPLNGMMPKTTPTEPTAPVMVELPTPPTTQGVAQKTALLPFPGHNATSVLRYMGLHGWAAEESLRVMTTLGYKVEMTTVRAQLNAGRKRERGPAADLTPTQVAQLKELKDA